MGSARGRRREEVGQSTVELMLMIPIIFAMLFFVIEMGLYFSAVHYANYGTYVAARCRAAGYGADGAGGGGRDATYVTKLVLTGSVFKGNYFVSDTSSLGVTVQMQSWVSNFPFINALLPDMAFATSVNLGPDESVYERTTGVPCTDNDIQSNPC